MRAWRSRFCLPQCESASFVSPQPPLYSSASSSEDDRDDESLLSSSRSDCSDIAAVPQLRKSYGTREDDKLRVFKSGRTDLFLLSRPHIHNLPNNNRACITDRRRRYRFSLCKEVRVAELPPLLRPSSLCEIGDPGPEDITVRIRAADLTKRFHMKKNLHVAYHPFLDGFERPATRRRYLPTFPGSKQVFEGTLWDFECQKC
jgi:hypothetical protein